MSKAQQKDSPDWLLPQNYSLADTLKPKEQQRYTVHMKKPRLPTEAEKEDLLDYILLENKDESAENRSNVYSLFFGGDSLVCPVPAILYKRRREKDAPGKVTKRYGREKRQQYTPEFLFLRIIIKAREWFTWSSKKT